CACLVISTRLSAQIRCSTSRWVKPEAVDPVAPVAIRRLSPATRTMKNSSRLLAKIAANLARSSSGTSLSSASSSTRLLNWSQEDSRSRKRGRSAAGSMIQTLAREGELRVSGGGTPGDRTRAHNPGRGRCGGEREECYAAEPRRSYMVSTARLPKPRDRYNRTAGVLSPSTYKMTFSSPDCAKCCNPTRASSRPSPAPGLRIHAEHV